MNSLFASNKLLSGMKRRSRPNSKSDPVSARAKPLEILPNVSEEDEGRASCSSIESLGSANPYRGPRSLTLSPRLSSKDPAERKRDSRRVVLTGAENLTFEDFFTASGAPTRPTPAPLLYKADASCESPLDDINLRFSGLGIELAFPSPPSDSPTTPVRRRRQSPTPSVSSSATSVTSSSTSSSGPKLRHVTPPTSDDESQPHLMRAPTCKSHRASIIFAKSMPDLSQAAQADMASSEEEDVDSDVEWFARDISDVVTLSTPLPPAFPLSSTAADTRARPDSIMGPPSRTGRSRHSKPLPNVPRLSIQNSIPQGRPSAQLDPMFPHRRKSFLIPDRPPPPPPIQITQCSDMERQTEELLAELASAALSSGFLGTGFATSEGRLSPTCSIPPAPSSAFVVSSRPPPRMSIPADIFDFSDETPYTPGVSAGLEVHLAPEIETEAEPETRQEWPSSPVSASLYSQPSMSAGSLPNSPASAFSFSVDGHGHSEAGDSFYSHDDLPAERILRSRWSSSTLGSQLEREPASASWMTRFNFSPSKRGRGKGAPAPSPSPSPSPSKSSSPTKSPLSPALKRSFDLERLERRDSRSSRMSDAHSDSGDSTASAGLRRKPIPVEMFIRA